VDVYHTSTLLLQCSARGLLEIQYAKMTQKIAICTPSHNFVGLNLRNQGTYRQSGKKLVKQQYLLHVSLNMANFVPLAVAIGSGVWGIPSNFNGFRVLASLLQRRCSPEANQTLHDVLPSPGLVCYIYIHFQGSCLLTEFCHVQNSLCIQVLRFAILAALLHGTRSGVSQTVAWY